MLRLPQNVVQALRRGERGLFAASGSIALNSPVFQMKQTPYLGWLILVASCFMVACTPPVDHGWSGYVEGEYIYIAAPIAGTLTTLNAQRGNMVTRGTPLFALDSEAERAARAEASARVSNARAQAANTDKGKRGAEIAVIEAQLTQARTQASLATRELARQQQLVERGFVSRAHLDEARTAEQTGLARVAELSASLRVARLPARNDERAAAVASTQAAEAALEQSKWREGQKRQVAPTNARIADTFYREGEWVNAGQPVVSLLPPAGTKVRFFIPETELGAIAINQAVIIQCDGCDAPISAHISFIATQAEYTPPVIYSNSQRARLVFMIEARPDPKDGPRLRPGQPVEVRRVK